MGDNNSFHDISHMKRNTQFEFIIKLNTKNKEENLLNHQYFECPSNIKKIHTLASSLFLLFVLIAVGTP